MEKSNQSSTAVFVFGEAGGRGEVFLVKRRVKCLFPAFPSKSPWQVTLSGHQPSATAIILKWLLLLDQILWHKRRPQCWCHVQLKGHSWGTQGAAVPCLISSLSREQPQGLALLPGGPRVCPIPGWGSLCARAACGRDGGCGGAGRWLQWGGSAWVWQGKGWALHGCTDVIFHTAGHSVSQTPSAVAEPGTALGMGATAWGSSETGSSAESHVLRMVHLWTHREWAIWLFCLLLLMSCLGFGCLFCWVFLPCQLDPTY